MMYGRCNFKITMTISQHNKVAFRSRGIICKCGESDEDFTNKSFSSNSSQSMIASTSPNTTMVGTGEGCQHNKNRAKQTYINTN